MTGGDQLRLATVLGGTGFAVLLGEKVRAGLALAGATVLQIISSMRDSSETRTAVSIARAHWRMSIASILDCCTG